MPVTGREADDSDIRYEKAGTVSLPCLLLRLNGGDLFFGHRTFGGGVGKTVLPGKRGSGDVWFYMTFGYTGAADSRGEQD